MMYNMISENPESTVVAEFQPKYKGDQSYQTEAELEKEFIEELIKQGYEYLHIKNEKDLIANLRHQLEKLNEIQFTDKEWDDFFKSYISNSNMGIIEKTTTIQEDYIKVLKRDDGSIKNIYLIDKVNIHRNYLQVINQYQSEGNEGRANRYDVTILVNGLPLVHIELKRRGVALEEAFNQINRYQRESFWEGTGLFEYVQIFVISNGTLTKYYSNTTRDEHIKEQKKQQGDKTRRVKNSFEFTSWWTDEQNNRIMDLIDFVQTFFTRNRLLNIITKYCVFTSDRQLLVMRPYQIVATEKIINKITSSYYNSKYGSKNGGGYIWHTTGSGKTLTSFKTAQLATKLPFVDKVLFVVDRKDLDYQTMKEYDRFEKGAANSNANTAILKKQLEDPNARIIITTIQKLERFVKQNKNHPVYEKQVVMIFDECHRSQFGSMHKLITSSFKKYYIFGFTGTPIFEVNASKDKNSITQTTYGVFGDRLHTYNLLHAIADKNVLPFKVDYVSTMREKENIDNSKIYDIDREKALLAPERIQNIVQYILEHFDQKTKRNKHAKLEEKEQKGFNSIMAVSSIDAAKMYYAEFKKQLSKVPKEERIKVGLIYSFGVNEDVDGMVDENSEDTSGLDQSSRDFLESAIADFNEMFGTSYDTSSEKFQNYYKEVSRRMKEGDLDLLIVVNMFLTGFDAPRLNTLWVDKNLRYHGLLQAFSRTNRILNSVKTHGNIVCFRNLEENTNEAIALFSDKDASEIVLLKSYKDYYYGYTEGNKRVEGYKELVERLLNEFPVDKPIDSEQSQKEFIKLYGQILKLQNILTTFDEFAGNEILTERQTQDYRSIYINLYNEYRKVDGAEKEEFNDDLVFEMELIKQIEINIDYILELLKKYRNDKKSASDIISRIDKAIDATIQLRNKKDLIMEFVHSYSAQPTENIEEKWQEYVNEKRVEELERIIEEENLNKEETYKFMSRTFKTGILTDIGTEFRKILPPISLFTPTGELTKKRKSVMAKLRTFFDRFFDISEKNFTIEE